MKKQFLHTTNFILVFIGIGLSAVYSQSISGVLRNKKTGETIAYADIKTAGNYGVITNRQGEFSIQTKNLEPRDSITFSSMGYQQKSIALKDYKQKIIYLSPAITRLADVYLVNKKLTPEEIIEKVRANAAKNYASEYHKFSIFKRESQVMKPTTFDFVLKQASFLSRKKRKHFNKKLEEMAEDTKITSYLYKDYYVDLFHGEDNEFKLNQFLATELSNPDKQVSTKGLVHRIFSMIGEKLKSANTFTVKTGLFPLKDDLDIKTYIKEQDSLKTDENKKEFVSLYQKYNLSSPHLDFITAPENYNYSLGDLTNYNREMVYEISFQPKNDNAKYKGKLYVSTKSFAVIKLNSQLTEGNNTPGILKFLFGIKHETNAESNRVVYQKNDQGKYSIRYIENTGRERVYLNRRLALIENSNKKDRIKLKAKIHVDIDQHIKKQYLFVKSQSISASDYADFNENSGITIKHIEKYNPEIWEEYNIISPDEAIKNFKS